jgi:hypothetical protein
MVRIEKNVGTSKRSLELKNSLSKKKKSEGQQGREIKKAREREKD